MNTSTTARHVSGKLVWSVDVPEEAASPAGPDIGQRVRSLLETFAEFQAPATWAFSHPASRASLCHEILRRSGQEVALQGDASWVLGETQRGRFARELTHRATAARAAGIDLQCLALRDAELAGSLDVLVRNQISVVRDDVAADRRAVMSRRFGIWRIAPAARVHASGWMQAARIKRILRQAATWRQTVLLAIDATQDEQGVDRQVRKICRFAARHPALEMVSLVATGQKLLRAPRGAGGRSILRAA